MVRHMIQPVIDGWHASDICATISGEKITEPFLERKPRLRHPHGAGGPPGSPATNVPVTVERVPEGLRF
jgi:hypothetical protein